MCLLIIKCADCRAPMSDPLNQNVLELFGKSAYNELAPNVPKDTTLEGTDHLE